jgi:hypothetical protein
MLEPSEQPQPRLCGMATMPSTCGYFSREKIVYSLIVAICLA